MLQRPCAPSTQPTRLPAMRAMDVPPPTPDVVPLPPSPHPVPPSPATPPEIIEPPLPGQAPVRDPVVVPGESLFDAVLPSWTLH